MRNIVSAIAPTVGSLALALAGGTVLLPPPAYARGHGGGWGWGVGWGLLGVGLGVDALLGWPGYYYPYGPYPYYGPAASPITVVQPVPAAVTPAAQSWYYCDKPKGYYPYVRSCQSAWQPVSPTPPAAP